MQIEITLKNYRCFQDCKPARIVLSKGFVAFIGVNNSGKSSLLKFFYEFRLLFAGLSSTWQNIFQEQLQNFSFPREVLDPQEVFCNANDRPLEIQLKFISDTAEDNLPTSSKLIITIPRNSTTYSAKLYLDKELISGKTGFGLKGSELWSDDNYIANLSYISEAFLDLSKTIYIGPFRNSISLMPVLDPSLMTNIDRNYFDYFDIKNGRSFIQKWRTLKTGSDRKNNYMSLKVTEDIKHIFGFKSLEINSSDDDQTIKMFIDGNPYTLSELGSGLTQFFLVLANVAIKEPSYILIDEPELNLHPSLQLDFLTTLANYATKGILFATHSIGLARASAERIYTVRKDGEGSEVTEYEKNPRLSELLGELSFSTYKEFGFDKVLLVEGPTEIKTIQQFLRKYQKDHEILLIPLGGSSLINDSFESELEEIKRISDNIFALIDSERTSSSTDLEPTRQAFSNMCKRIGIGCHVLERRATENYFSDRVVKLVKGEKFRGLQPYEKLADVPHGWSKTENWRLAREMTINELEETDLGAFIKKICE